MVEEELEVGIKRGNILLLWRAMSLSLYHPRRKRARHRETQEEEEEDIFICQIHQMFIFGLNMFFFLLQIVAFAIA